ncbi:hypothetical protein, partial [Vibrio alfacsensis]|uniref:hypothetical protein n=1 Tax=Vibrio alfacsensis TaxID=1074311 RepID=UPI00406777C3
ESTGLENRRTLIAYLGFKSLSLRHIEKPVEKSTGFFLISEIPKGIPQNPSIYSIGDAFNRILPQH